MRSIIDDKSGCRSGILPDRPPGAGQAQPDKSGGEHAANHRRDENKRARIEESDIDDRGARGKFRRIPNPTPKIKAADNIKGAWIAGARGIRIGPPSRATRRRRARANATSPMTSAPPITKASEGSKSPARSRKPSTLAGSVMPETHRPRPKTRPTARADDDCASGFPDRQLRTCRTINTVAKPLTP